MEEQVEKFNEYVEPGLTVNWFRGHQENENARQVAVVVNSNGQGVLDLAVLPKMGGGPIERVRSCYHVSRQDALRDVNGVPNTNAIKYGCWEFTKPGKILHQMASNVVDEDELEDAACLNDIIEETVAPEFAKLIERIAELEKKCEQCSKPAAKRSTKKKADES